MDLYNDKARYDSFLNEQNNIESGFRQEQDNFSNQLQNAKLAATENKQIGSEMFFQSMPQALMEGQHIYTKIKGVYDTAQKVAAQAQKIKGSVSDAVSNIKTQAGSLIEDTKAKAGGLLEDAKAKAGGLLEDTKAKLEDAKGMAGISLEDAKGQAGGLLKSQIPELNENLVNSPETTIKLKRADLIDKANAYHDELNPVFPELGETERQMDLDEVNNASDSKIVSMHEEAGLSVNRTMDDPLDIPTSLREVQFDNPLFQGGEKPIAETFGNVKNYLGGQIGEMGDKVSVLPNMETSIGSLKQAMPKVPTMENIGGADLAGSEAGNIVGGLKNATSAGASDAISSISNKATNVVSDVSDTVAKVGTDVLKDGASLLEESSVPVIGDVLAGIGLVSSLYEGIKGLVDKPDAPPPPPPVDVPTTVVQQAGI